jgi:uncharacterized membrane protein
VRKLFASWWFWAAVGVGLLALGIPAAFFWEWVLWFCQTYGGLLSAVGVLIAVIAFPLTLYAVLDAHRAGEKAQRDTQEAVRQAQAQVREAQRQAEQAIAQVEERYQRGLEAIRLSLALTDAEAAFRLVTSLRTAGGDGRWERAVVFCDEGRAALARLRSTARRLGAEVSGLFTTAAEDIEIVRSYIERNKLPREDPAPGFDVPRNQALIRMAGNLESALVFIRGQLQEI